MMFQWDMFFNWDYGAGDEVPCMSGGLLAISRDWWFESGTLDTGMDLWGAENIEQVSQSVLLGTTPMSCC